MGVNALNPVQVNAARMEPARLKRDYGDRLAFWAAFDTFHVMPPRDSTGGRGRSARQDYGCLGRGGDLSLTQSTTFSRMYPGRE